MTDLLSAREQVALRESDLLSTYYSWGCSARMQRCRFADQVAERFSATAGCIMAEAEDRLGSGVKNGNGSVSCQGRGS
jgi:hypothetical protein